MFFVVANSRPKMQSQVLDQVLFPNKAQIEIELKEKHPLFSEFAYHKNENFEKSQPWIGLHPQNLETTYIEFVRLFEFLSQNNFSPNKIIDIGSAYGRAGVVAPSVFPEVEFEGYEIVKERVDESNLTYHRLGLENSKSFHRNVMKEDIGFADLFIIYDFSHLEDIFHLIDKLRRKFGKRGFLLAVRGNQSPKIIKKGFSDFLAVACPVMNSKWNVFQVKY